MDARAATQRFIRWVMRDVTYHKHYPCTVQSTGSGPFDLLPDDEQMRGDGLKGVPLANPLPGVAVTVPTGARAMLFFEAGDPSRPACYLIGGTPISISFLDGTAPVARVGDTVVIDAASSATGGPVTGTGTIMAGAPKVTA